MKRITVVTAVLVIAAASVAAVASAAHQKTTFTASPRGVVPGHVVTFSGTHWATADSCTKPEVVLTVEAGFGQLGILVGRPHVRSDGSWTLRWRAPKAEQIGTSLTILAREYCETGTDSSAIAIEKARKIHFVGLPA